MSKIGQYNIEMTEYVNELGYETVEEAIADGWDSAEFYASYRKQTEDEQTKAHEAWLEEKKKVLGGLMSLYLGYSSAGKSDSTEASIVLGAMDFINKGEQ